MLLCSIKRFFHGKKNMTPPALTESPERKDSIDYQDLELISVIAEKPKMYRFSEAEM